MPKNRTKKLVTETAWFAIGNFGSKILSLLLVPLYTSILTTEEYGTVDILLTTVTLLIPVLTLEMADGVFRFTLDRAYDTRRVATSCLSVAAVSWSGLLVLYPVLRLALPSMMEYWWYFFFVYVTGSISTVLASFMKGVDKSHIFAIQGVIFTFVFAVSNIVFLLWLRLGVCGYLLSRICANVAAILFMIVWGKATTYVSPRCFDWRLLKEILRFSAPMIPAAIAWWVMSSIDRYMLLYMDSVAATGLYGVAHKLPSVITVLTNFFISAWQITAVRSKDDTDIGDYTSRVFEILFLIGMLLTFGMILFSRVLGNIFFAKDFFAAWSMMSLLTVATVFSTFSLFLGAQFTAAKRSDLHLRSNLLTMGINIVLNFLMIPTMGAAGAALATMLSYFAVLAYRQIKVKGLISLAIDTRKFYGACVCVMLAAFATAFGLRGWPVITVVLMLAVLLAYRRDTVELVRQMLRYASGLYKKIRRT